GAARQIFFLEADHVRELTDLPTTLDLPISSYPNLAFSIHPYTHKYTVDALAGLKPDHSPYPIGGYQQSHATGQAEARSLGAPAPPAPASRAAPCPPAPPRRPAPSASPRSRRPAPRSLPW